MKYSSKNTIIQLYIHTRKLKLHVDNVLFGHLCNYVSHTKIIEVKSVIGFSKNIKRKQYFAQIQTTIILINCF